MEGASWIKWIDDAFLMLSAQNGQLQVKLFISFVHSYVDTYKERLLWFSDVLEDRKIANRYVLVYFGPIAYL